LVLRSPHVLVSPDSRVFTRLGRERSFKLSPSSLELPASFRASKNLAALTARRYSRQIRLSSSLEVFFPPAFPRLRLRHIELVYLASSPNAYGFSQPLDALTTPNLPALFHAGSAHGISPFRAFFLLRSLAPSLAPLPSCRCAAGPFLLG
jgi:hypothetical protein